ncbi:MAG: phosphoribosylanthranilate isomerase [Cyanobacteria bacterium]|nr:phosphoribosylanthranilate isomerase [Cyanobacteriota bacterium]
MKICGLRQPDQAAAIAGMGVAAIGVIAVQTSPRFVLPEQRAELFRAAKTASPACLGVVVVADPQATDLEWLSCDQGHDVLQLHGQESAERCQELRQSLGVKVWKALRLRERADLTQAILYAQHVDGLLLDAWAADQLGGTGQRLPLEWLQGFKPAVPWWLAGGIASNALPEILSRVRPDGLDVSSAVENSPGDKDLDRVADLVRAINHYGNTADSVANH